MTAKNRSNSAPTSSANSNPAPDVWLEFLDLALAEPMVMIEDPLLSKGSQSALKVVLESLMDAREDFDVLAEMLIRKIAAKVPTRSAARAEELSQFFGKLWADDVEAHGLLAADSWAELSARLISREAAMQYQAEVEVA